MIRSSRPIYCRGFYYGPYACVDTGFCKRKKYTMFFSLKKRESRCNKSDLAIAKDKDKSALLILLSVLFRFLAYSGIDHLLYYIV